MPPTLLDQIFHMAGLLSDEEKKALAKYAWDFLDDDEKRGLCARDTT